MVFDNHKAGLVLQKPEVHQQQDRANLKMDKGNRTILYIH